MNLYLVKTADASVDLWVAHETDDGDLYVYVQNTGKFHRNTALEDDFYIDQELTYEPITAAAAREVVAGGAVGKLDARTKSAQVQRYENDTDALDAASILGVKTTTRTDAQIREARVKVLRNAKPGVAVTWKKYSAAEKHLARVAVTDINKKKIKMLDAVGPLDVWIEDNAGDVLVRVARAKVTQGEATAKAKAAATAKAAAKVEAKKALVRKSAGKKKVAAASRSA